MARTLLAMGDGSNLAVDDRQDYVAALSPRGDRLLIHVPIHGARRSPAKQRSIQRGDRAPGVPGGGPLRVPIEPAIAGATTPVAVDRRDPLRVSEPSQRGQNRPIP